MTPALACLLAWAAGVAFATVVIPVRPAAAVAALAGASVAGGAALCARLVGLRASVAFALAACLLGVARAEIPGGDPTAATRAPALAGSQAVVDGVVSDDPRQLAGGVELLVAPDRLGTSEGAQRPAGSVIAFVRGAPNAALGDRVQLTGRLDLPRDQPGFDRRAYVAQRGVFLEMRTAQVSVLAPAGGPRALPGWLRDRYREAIERLLPAPHAQVLVGVVLGIRTGIPARLQRDLISTGLVHLLVLSGLKVAVFARIVSGLLAPLLGRSSALPAVVLIAVYALAGGATPAAVRAAAMGGLALLAARLGRPTHVWTSLGATAAGMLAWRPELAWDVGFQLSFAGTAAIVLLTPGIERGLERAPWLRRLPAWLREPFAVTCAAQVGSVPLMANDFHLLSPVAPVANAAVLPLLPVLVAAGLMLAPLAAVPDLGELAGLPLTGLLVYLEQVATLLARIPAAAIPVRSFPAWAGAAYYAAVAGGLGAARSSGRTRHLALAAGILIPLLIGGAELVAWARPAPAVAVLAVGAGQAVLLTGPDGAVLVDGGASPAKLADELGARLPPWTRSLTALVITGPGIEHVGGLAGLTYPAGTVVVPDASPPGTAWRNVALTEEVRGASLRPVHAGFRLALAGLWFDVLSPEPAAAQAEQLALRVSRPGGGSFCDLADLDPDGQAAAATWLTGTCDILLLPSGGRSAPAPDLLRAARPRHLVASDTGGNLARGLPRGEISRTSQEGTVVLAL